jgi:ATP phosphoribosyltransferase
VWSPAVDPLGTDFSSNAVPAAMTGKDKNCVRFGFPKGSLQKSTEELFARAGLPVKVKDRNYFPTVDDDGLSLVLFRSQEIPRYVADNVLDAGICGRDWIVENGSDVIEVAELKYSKATSNPARWVVAVPEDSPVRTAEDLEGTLIASELVNTTQRFFLDRDIHGVKVEYSWGATEVKASLPGVGAIVDITETGSSLRANKLREVATILESTTRLIANKDAWEDPIKRARIEDLALLLQGAIDGKKKVGLKMNLPTASVPELSAQLPSEKSPTVSPLLDADYCAVEVVVDEGTAKDLIPVVRRMGATGIVTYPINLSIH